MNSIERKQASLERRTRDRMREREDELESVYGGEPGQYPTVPVRDPRDPRLKRQTSDVSFSNHYRYEKYYAQQDFDPP